MYSSQQVKATDADGPGNDSKITYSIRDGNGLGRFTIDPQDGVIRTNERLDRETQSLYWLTVYAQDSGAVPLFRYRLVWDTAWVERANACFFLTLKLFV